jgi:hypothetical protein
VKPNRRYSCVGVDVIVVHGFVMPLKFMFVRFEMKYSKSIAKIEKILSDNGIDLEKIDSAGHVEIDGKNMAVISFMVVMPLSEAASG